MAVAENDYDYRRLGQIIRECQGRLEDLEEYRCGQLHNARVWLREILEGNIAAENKFVRFDGHNWTIHDAIEVLQEIDTEGHYYKDHNGTAYYEPVSQSVKELQRPYNEFEFWQCTYEKLDNWAEQFSCGNLRERVRKMIANQEIVIEHIVNHDGYVNYERASDWAAFLKMAYDALLEYDVVNGYGTTIVKYPLVEDDDRYYPVDVQCPFCTGGGLVVLVGDIEREQWDVDYVNKVSERHVTKYHYSLTDDVGIWYKEAGYWRLNFYIKCSNEYCGFYRPLIDEVNEDEDCSSRSDWTHNLKYWFPVSGVIYIDMFDPELPGIKAELPKRHLDLDDLMQDRYFLEWVH